MPGVICLFVFYVLDSMVYFWFYGLFLILWSIFETNNSKQHSEKWKTDNQVSTNDDNNDLVTMERYLDQNSRMPYAEYSIIWKVLIDHIHW